MALSVRTRAWIHGTRNAWSLGPRGDEPGTECEVALEIQGDEREGFHLIMSPAGFFTADNWYRTSEEALRGASELFDVNAEEWKQID
jgi:hypothetical protein